MKPGEVLTAVTSLPAQVFGLRDRGAIRPGLWADMVLVEGNPVQDIAATRKIRAVWITGEPLDLKSI